MTGYENDCLKALSREIYAVDKRVIRVETKVDDAAEAREVAREQMHALSSRLTYMLGITVAAWVAIAGAVGGLTYAVTGMTKDIEQNQVTIRENQRETNSKLDVILRQVR